MPHKKNVGRDEIIDLVRSLDSVRELSSEPDEALFSKIVSAPARKGSAHLRLGLVVGVAIIALGSAATAIAIGSGLVGLGQETKSSALEAANYSGVANVQVLATSENGRAGVIEGVKSSNKPSTLGAQIADTKVGEPVVTFVLGGASLGFRSLADTQKQLTDQNLIVVSGGQGEQNKVTWMSATGLVSQRVARLVLTGENGEVREVPVSSGAFAIDIDPSYGNATLTAYDAAGKEVARQALGEVSPP